MDWISLIYSQVKCFGKQVYMQGLEGKHWWETPVSAMPHGLTSQFRLFTLKILDVSQKVTVKLCVMNWRLMVKNKWVCSWSCSQPDAPPWGMNTVDCSAEDRDDAQHRSPFDTEPAHVCVTLMGSANGKCKMEAVQCFTGAKFKIREVFASYGRS